MLDLGGARGPWRREPANPELTESLELAESLQLAESLGLAMARRACEILDRHRAALARPARDPAPRPARDPAQSAADEAIFTAVLDATSDCLGQSGPLDPEDRWCDALLHLLLLARLADPAPPHPS